MKSLIKYLILNLVISFFNGCDKPAPTELLPEENDIEVEVLAKDTDDDFYAADSSGVPVDELNRFANIISVSGIKISRGNVTLNSSFAQAIFFDRSQPVIRNGETFIYFTRALGDVQFNNTPARKIPFIIRYKERGNHQQVNLGPRHVLNSFIPDQNFNYHYGSSVLFNLEFSPLLGGGSVQFPIPTPAEVNGTVKLNGTRTNGTLSAILNWNTADNGKFEIIISASSDSSEKVFPLFRLRTEDDGELIIPEKLINRIPHRFNRIIFSLVRRFESSHSGNNYDLYVLSQSIHSLVADIP
jgi:hypothetical protein